jgi:glycosyltransferase involved in cell wall biosynthesis
MIRILIHTDTPCFYSGLARCGRELAKRFLETVEIIDNKTTKKFELAYAGWHHQPKRHEYPYFIYPIGKGISHEAREFKDILDDFKPEVILSIGDIWNFSKIADTIYNYKEINRLKWLLWLTVDGENWHPTWKRILDLADETYVFSEFGKNEVQKLVGFAPKVIYPGVDKSVFKKMSVDFKTREAELPFKIKDTFIILNVNQNTDRKNIPLTIEAFADFAKDKKDVFLLLVTNPDDSYGFDLWNLVEKFDLRKKVAITKESGPLKGMSDEKLNLIYNLASVSVNTSIGEGFSLPTLEAMAVGLPVLTTDYAAISELIDQGGGYRIDVAAYLYGYNGIRRAIASKDDLIEKLDILYKDFKTDKILRTAIATKSAAFTDLLTWDKTAKIFIDGIESMMKSKEEKISFLKTKVKIKDINPLIVIPSWGKNCGIAEYTKSLLEAMRDLKQSSVIFSSYLYQEVSKLVETQKYNLVHIQHEFSFFKSKLEFEQLLNSLNELKVKTIVTMHSLVPAMSTVNDFLLTRTDNVIVHCDYFKKILEDYAITKKEILPNICNIEVIEMGCGDIFPIDENRINETKRNLNLSNRYPVIGSFGFLREQKGYQDLLLAVKELRNQYKDILLLIVAPKHEFGSKVYDEIFYNFIEKHNLQDNVLIIREYLEEEKLLSVLQCANAFVLNYVDSPYGGGVSAAVKTLFRVQRPILVREGIAFADLINGEVLKIRDASLSSLIEAIKVLIEDKTLGTSLVNNANDFLLRNNWKNVAQKHIDLYNK